MNAFRLLLRSVLIGALCFALFCFAASDAARAQEAGAPQQQMLQLASPEVARGRQLLEQGDAAGAVAALQPVVERDKLDGEAWHLLGLAYKKLGKEKEALHASGQAVVTRLERLAPAGFPNAERMVRMPAPERASLRQRALARYQEAIESVEAYVQLNPKTADFWRSQVSSLQAHAELLRGDDEFKDIRPDSTAVRLVINNKPDPGYTEEARRNGTGGRVMLRAVFGADGKVRDPIVIRRLPHGLTEQAFEAARRISFQPATVNGRPVSQFLTLEYGFDIQRGPVYPRLPRRGFPLMPAGSPHKRVVAHKN